MVIRFGCSDCGFRLRVEDSLAGKRVRCRDCDRTILAPDYGEEPGVRDEGAPGKAEVLGSLLTPRISRADKKRTRKVAMGLAVVFLLGAFTYLGLQYFRTTPLPDIVLDLPEGDFFVYRNGKGSAFFREGKSLFPGTTEIATVYRPGKRLEQVSIYKGNHDVAKVKRKLKKKGYRVTGNLLQHGEESAWITGTRIVHGSTWLVEEALRVGDRKANRFVQGLSPRQKATWSRLVPGDFIYFGKKTSWEETRIIGEYSRGFLGEIGGGDTGIGAIVTVLPEGRAHFTIVVGIRGEYDVPNAIRMLQKLGSQVESTKSSQNRDVFIYSGDFFQRRLVMRANELSAIRSLLSLGEAQEKFKNGNRNGDGIHQYWTSDISGLLSGGVIDKDLAAADLRPAEPGDAKRAHRGYWFVLLKGAPTQYTLAALPALPGTSGEFTFVMTQDRKVWEKATRGVLPESWPEKGWEEASRK